MNGKRNPHTPGLWRAVRREFASPMYPDLCWDVVTDDERNGGDMVLARTSDWDSRANAFMMAAAPDLLAALGEVVSEALGACHAIVLSRDVGGPRITGTAELDRAIDTARAALAKARGE